MSRYILNSEASDRWRPFRLFAALSVLAGIVFWVVR